MNDRGQVIFFTFMIGLTVLVLAMALAFPVSQGVENTTNNTGNSTTANLDCGNSSISTFDKGACIVSDISTFYFVGGLIFLVGSILLARVIL